MPLFIAAKGTNITEEMWKDYVKLTHNKIIPIENIKNVYEAGKLICVISPDNRGNHRDACCHLIHVKSLQKICRQSNNILKFFPFLCTSQIPAVNWSSDHNSINMVLVSMRDSLELNFEINLIIQMQSICNSP